MSRPSATNRFAFSSICDAWPVDALDAPRSGFVSCMPGLAREEGGDRDEGEAIVLATSEKCAQSEPTDADLQVWLDVSGPTVLRRVRRRATSDPTRSVWTYTTPWPTIRYWDRSRTPRSPSTAPRRARTR